MSFPSQTASPLGWSSAGTQAPAREKWTAAYTFLCILIVSLPFETYDFGLGLESLSIAKLIGWILFALAFLQPNLCLKYRPVGFVLFLTYILAFTIMALAGDSDYLRDSMSRLAQIVQMLVLFLVAYNIMLNPLARDRAVLMLFWMGIALFVLQRTAFGSTIDADEFGSRYSVLGENVNNVGATMSLSFLAAISLARERVAYRKYRGLIYLGAAAMLYGVVRTASRGAMIAAFLGVACFTLRREVFGKRMVTIFMALAAVAGLIFFVLQFDTGLAKWQRTINDGDTSHRSDIFFNAVDMITEKPFLGWGPEVNLRELGSREGLERRDTHNLYAWVLTETGILGGLPYLFALLAILLPTIRARTTVEGVLPLAFMVFLLTYNATDTWFNRKQFWIVLAYCCAAGQQYTLSAISNRRLRQQLNG